MIIYLDKMDFIFIYTDIILNINIFWLSLRLFIFYIGTILIISISVGKFKKFDIQNFKNARFTRLTISSILCVQGTTTQIRYFIKRYGSRIAVFWSQLN